MIAIKFLNRMQVLAQIIDLWALQKNLNKLMIDKRMKDKK